MKTSYTERENARFINYKEHARKSSWIFASFLLFTLAASVSHADATLASVIADVVSHPSPSDARLLSDIRHISNLHVVYVKQTATGANNGTSWKNAYTSLQSALSNVNGDTEILVAGGTYSAGTSAGSTFSLPDGVAIIGGFDAEGERELVNNPTYLTGVGGTTVVTMNGVTDIIDGVNISGASTNGYGGAINAYLSNLLLYNMTFANDSSANGSGAIDSNGSSLAIFSSSFTNNSALGDGGAVNLYLDTQVTLMFNTFNNNSANHGGAIEGDEGNASGPNWTISNNSFNNNNSRGRGGAIRIVNGGPNRLIMLSNDSFNNNSTGSDGGAVAILSSSQSNQVMFSHDVFKYNSSAAGPSGYGGAIEWLFSDGTITVDSSIFDHNTGGDTLDASFSGTGAVTITNDIFSDNRSIGGGAVGTAGTYLDGQVTYNNDLFVNNSSEARGGAISDKGSKQVTIKNSALFANSATQQGGAIWLSSGTVTIAGDVFGNNTAPQGSSIWLDGAGPFVNGDPVWTNWVNDLVSSNYNLPGTAVFLNPPPSMLFSFESGTENWLSAGSNAGTTAQKTDFHTDGSYGLEVVTADGGWFGPSSMAQVNLSRATHLKFDLLTTNAGTSTEIALQLGDSWTWCQAGGWSWVNAGTTTTVDIDLTTLDCPNPDLSKLQGMYIWFNGGGTFYIDAVRVQ